MRNTAVAILFCAVALFSCKRHESNRDKLIGTWRAIKMENPELDSFYRNTQNFIDTFGKGHDDATNIQIYGVANVDSMRQLLQMQHDSARATQADAVTQTFFTFRRDSVALLSFSGALDSSKWSVDASGNLVLSEMSPSGPAETMTMEILSLTDTVMKLKMHENNVTSTVTFIPDKK